METEPLKDQEEVGNDEWVGPTPEEMIQHKPKKRKVLQHEALFLNK